MSFIEKLEECQTPYESLNLIKEENYKDILCNIKKLISLWTNYNIKILLKTIIESNIFSKEEIKEILLEVISFLESNGKSSNSILAEFGCDIKYNKNDIKKIFLIISSSRIKSNFLHTETMALNINKKLYNAVFNEEQMAEKNVQMEMLELISKFVEKWNIKVSEEDLINLISWKCKETKIMDFFVYNPMAVVIDYLDKIINKIVDEEFDNEALLIGCGSFSMVFKQNTKVIKVNFSDEQYTSYNCDCILNFNTTRTEKLENGTPILTIGSQNIAICNWYKDLSQEEINLKMYEVFCRARNQGYIITDIKKENFGVVDEQLKIIDGGFIYAENNFDISKIEQLVPLTTRPIFEYFMNLYDNGYTINDKNELIQSGIIKY